MEKQQVHQLTVQRALDASRQSTCGGEDPARSRANASFIAGMPGAALASKWYGNPDRLTSLRKRPPN